MNKFEVTFWSSVDWRWTTFYVLAHNRDQVWGYVDEVYYPAEYRQKNGLDSLKIKFLNEVSIPYEVPA